MKILHFAKAFNAITETFIRSYVEKSKESFEVSQLADEGETGYDFNTLPPLYFERKDFWNYLNNKLGYYSIRERYWKRIINSYDPHIIHCHFGKIGVECDRLFRKTKQNIPFVTSFYGYDAFRLPFESKVYRTGLDSLFRNRNAYFFAEGPHLRRQLISLGADEDRVMINPLLVDIKESNYHQAKEPFKILLVGRFVEKKGFHVALEALGQLKEQLPKFKVTIIGFGDLEPLYKEIANKYRIEDRVFFAGKQPHDEVKKQLGESHFFLHPSVTAKDGDSEGGAPTIIIEAQAAGLPIIASDHADIPYVMGYHNFLSKQGDIESLKQTILASFSFDDWRNLIQQGKHHVKSQHDFKESSIYEENLKSIINTFAKNKSY